MEKLLIINPGSTSTKIAVYNDEEPVFVESISHSAEEIGKYDAIADQYEFRRDLILKCLEEKKIDIDEITAIVARGGLLPPIKAGAYEINEDMVWKLKNEPVNEHASNLAAIIAYDIAARMGIPSYIYDGVTVDEMLPITKISGDPEIERKGIGHNLNMRAAAMRYARENNKSYEECTLLVAHLGGGISVSLHTGGKIVDITNDEDGPFSPERAGGVPVPGALKLVASGKYTAQELIKKLKSRSGLVAYLGVNDTRDVQKMIDGGDDYAKFIYEAMAMDVAKCIAKLAPVVKGKVDAILLTGGIAYSELFTGMVKESVEFIAPVIVYAGENEMESLALGGLRVLRGQEKASLFKREK